MQKLSREILIEFLWLTLSLSLTFLLAVVLFGWTFLTNELSYWLPLVLLFFVVTFVINSIKKFRKNYRMTLQN
jgi:hypothetical protein